MDVRVQAVEVHIDLITFEGFDRVDVAAVRQALESGLARLIGEGGVPAQASERAGLRLGLEWSGGADAAELGGALAASLYEGMLP